MNKMLPFKCKLLSSMFPWSVNVSLFCKSFSIFTLEGENLCEFVSSCSSVSFIVNAISREVT